MDYVFMLVFMIMTQNGEELANGPRVISTDNIYASVESCQKEAKSRPTEERVGNSVFVTKWRCAKIKVQQ